MMMENINVNDLIEPVSLTVKVTGIRRFKAKIYLTEALIRIINWIGVVKIQEPE